MMTSDRVAILAPPWCSKFLSYVTGWMTVIGWQAGTVTTTYLSGAFIQGLLTQNYPEYAEAAWHGVLISYAAVLLSTFINTFLARYLPEVESVVFCVHIFGLLAIVIALSYFAPHSSAREVFANIQNHGEWQTNGLSFFIGLTTSMVAFIGIITHAIDLERLADRHFRNRRRMPHV